MIALHLNIHGEPTAATTPLWCQGFWNVFFALTRFSASANPELIADVIAKTVVSKRWDFLREIPCRWSHERSSSDRKYSCSPDSRSRFEDGRQCNCVKPWCPIDPCHWRARMEGLCKGGRWNVLSDPTCIHSKDIRRLVEIRLQSAGFWARVLIRSTLRLIDFKVSWWWFELVVWLARCGGLFHSSTNPILRTLLKIHVSWGDSGHWGWPHPPALSDSWRSGRGGRFLAVRRQYQNPLWYRRNPLAMSYASQLIWLWLFVSKAKCSAQQTAKRSQICRLTEMIYMQSR